MLPLLSRASPGMASLETHCAGSRQVPGATSPDEKLEAKLRAQGTRWPPAARCWPHQLQAFLAQPLLPGSICSSSVPTAGQSHLSSTPRPSYRHAQRERTAHTDTRTRTRVCTHANSSPPPCSRGLPRPRRSRVPVRRASSISPGLCRRGAVPRKGRCWTRAGGSACRTTSASAPSSPRCAPQPCSEQPPRHKKQRKPPVKSQPRPSSGRRNKTRCRCRRGGCAGEAGRGWRGRG